jgi:hypothetical protein
MTDRAAAHADVEMPIANRRRTVMRAMSLKLMEDWRKRTRHKE